MPLVGLELMDERQTYLSPYIEPEDCDSRATHCYLQVPFDLVGSTTSKSQLKDPNGLVAHIAMMWRLAARLQWLAA